jgi:anti-anti-sigma factor
VSLLRTPAAAVVRLSGELDIGTAGFVDATLRQLTGERPPPQRVIIDAEQLTFVDAGGLAPLLAALRSLPPGTLRMRNARPSVVRVLRVLDLATTFGLDA